jgi:hypothetical protein
MRTHIYVVRVNVRIQISTLSCICASVHMRVAIYYGSESARKNFLNEFRVRVRLGLGSGVETMFDFVRVANEAGWIHGLGW